MSHSPFIRIQCIPTQPPNGASKARIETYHTKIAKRREQLLVRCGLKKNDSRKDLRYCSDHITDNEKERNTKECIDKKTNLEFILNHLPSSNGVGNKSHFLKPRCLSKGLGFDRFATKCIQTVQQNDPELASWTKAIQNAFEAQTPRKDHIKINPTVKLAYDLPPTPVNKSRNGKKKCVKLRGLHQRTLHRSWLEPPKVLPFQSKEENQKYPSNKRRHKDVVKQTRRQKQHELYMKRKTGFDTEKDLLIFIIIVCNGDMNLLLKRTENSTLTWYEEWYVFRNFWGRTQSRWIDSSDVDDGYGIRKGTIISIYDNKLEMVAQCRESWPAFLWFEEDKKFCDESMKKKYEGLRPIFWDMTGMYMNKSSDAQMQRLAYSCFIL